MEIKVESRHLNGVVVLAPQVQKAQNVLSFHPQHDVGAIVANLLQNKAKFEDWDNPAYYNIQEFKRREKHVSMSPQAAVNVG